MPDAPDQDLRAALERLIAGQAEEADLPLLRQAVAEGRITLQSAARNSAGGARPAETQSGGVSFGQSNQIQISGSVIGAMTLSLPTAAEAARLLDTLQPFRPGQPPAPHTLPDPGALPPGSRLPFSRNAVFTGRQADLIALASHLLPAGQPAGGASQPGTGTPAAALTGTGGLGKTQLAVEFCYRYGRFFHGVHWLHADQDLTAELAACGLAMGLEPWPKTLAEQAGLTLLEWSQAGPRLVVLDNVADVRVVQEWLPRLPHARVLVTSRQRDWPLDLGLALHPLDSLPRAESRLLLYRLAPRLEKIPPAELDQVAGRLGDLPLALDLAGNYLDDRQGLSINAFLDELEKAGSALAHSALQDWTDHNPTQHVTSLAATFALSWNQLASYALPLASLAPRLFCAAGYCAANTPIPWDMFYLLLDAQTGQTQAAVDKALGALEDCGLLRLVESGAIIHPLLAEFARLQDAAADHRALPALSDALKTLAEQAVRGGLPEQYKPLRAHVETAAAWAEQNGLEQASALWSNLGYHLWQVAEFYRSKSAFEQALRIDEHRFGSVHPEVAGAASNLGLALRALGDYHAARALYERALRIYDATLSPDHPDISTALNNLGMVQRALGDFSAAKVSLERALRIDETAFGPDDPIVAIRVANLGAVLHGLGDYPATKAAFERALIIDTATYGPDHPNVARNTSNLGGVLLASGDYPGAKTAFERALALDTAAFGPDHPNVAIRTSKLGAVLQALGDMAGAQAAFERALAINTATFGPGHPDIARDINNLGEVWQALGDFDQAKAAFERALAIAEAAFGSHHPDIARYVNNLGEALNALGDHFGARDAIDRAIAIDAATLGPEHPNLARDFNSLGLVHKALGDAAAAEVAFSNALRIDEAALGSQHPNIARDVSHLGEMLQAQGDLSAAQAAYLRALAIYEKCLPPDHPQLQTVRRNLERLASSR